MQEKIKEIFQDPTKKILEPNKDCLNCLEAQCRRKNINLSKKQEEIKEHWITLQNIRKNYPECYKKKCPDCELFIGAFPFRRLIPFGLKRCLDKINK